MKILVLKAISSDFPFHNAGVIRQGIHEAKMNPLGAISCISDKGQPIGVKLNEFRFTSSRDRDDWIAIAYPNIPCVDYAREVMDDANKETR